MEETPTQNIAVNKKKSWLREIVEVALITMFIVVPFRIFVAQPFIVSGESMHPTFENGQYLIIDQVSYRFEEPKRESVAIFRYPLDPKKYFIKRIIGLPGDRVIVKNNTVSINGEQLDEKYLSKSVFTYGNLDITLKDSEYFVLGDNRTQSSDSRVWGILPRENIVGRPIVRLLPINKIAILPGDFSNNQMLENRR